jgi:shikimate dehydrogenase
MYNTDTTGFARAATELAGASSHGPVAVIGAGGVGKAIAFALAGLGVKELRLFDREPAKAADPAAKPVGRVKTSVALSVEDALRGVVGVVNASPVGMLPSLDTSVPDRMRVCGSPMPSIPRSGRRSSKPPRQTAPRS